MDDLVEAKVGVQVLLPYSVMLSEEPVDARAEMVDRAEPGFLFRYLRVHSYFLRYVQRSLIAVLGVMGDRAALVCYSVPRLSQLYSAWMPAASGEGFSGISLPCSCLRLPLWRNPGRSCLGQGTLRTR